MASQAPHHSLATTLLQAPILNSANLSKPHRLIWPVRPSQPPLGWQVQKPLHCDFGFRQARKITVLFFTDCAILNISSLSKASKPRRLTRCLFPFHRYPRLRCKQMFRFFNDEHRYAVDQDGHATIPCLFPLPKGSFTQLERNKPTNCRLMLPPAQSWTSLYSCCGKRRA